MQERLTFSHGATHVPPLRRPAPPAAAELVLPERRDWAYIGLLSFTALLFFRPQDHLPVLQMFDIAKLAALFALGALVFSRVPRGQPLIRLTPEVVGVFALGAVMLATVPFSIWPGGAFGVFTDAYLKIVLIFMLMLTTPTTPERLRRFTWLIIVASGYVAFWACLDYARGVNMIEGTRVQGSIGGIFQNPNDLALNLVTFLPLAIFVALQRGRAPRRLLAAACAAFMLAAIVFTQSRGGMVGLGAMLVVLGLQGLRYRPAAVGAGALALLLAAPLAPASFWERMESIVEPDKDPTGSREARRTLNREAWAAFLAHPVTGVGAGQFRAYDTEVREAPWRDVHNVPLQLASEMGIVAVAIFAFLLWRAALSVRRADRALRPRAPAGRRGRDRPAPPSPLLTREEQENLRTHSLAMPAALTGWFVCAMFAPVAYNWTFYYLLALAVMPHIIVTTRLRLALSREPAPDVRPREVVTA